MLKYGKSIYAMLLSVPLVVGCQPANDEKVQSELAALRQEVKDLKAQVESINSDIELAKENAAKTAKPKFRTLPDQKTLMAMELFRQWVMTTRQSRSSSFLTINALTANASPTTHSQRSKRITSIQERLST